MITDLFSHKIHSSGDEWPDKVAELAAVFNEFDGKIWDRAAIETRLRQISPRAAYVDVRDPSKFRDEIGAYPAYLGLYSLEQSSAGWRLRMSETAKRFLICEAPDVASFLRVQLAVFQYPNASGAAYRSGTNDLRMQANACQRTLQFVKEQVHLSPLRLVCLGLRADAQLRQVDLRDATLSFSEIFALANAPQVNRNVLPDLDAVSRVLDSVRRGTIRPPEEFESRFHILRHTEMFTLDVTGVHLRSIENDADAAQLERQFSAVCSIAAQFDGFDRCVSCDQIGEVISSGDWGTFFDGIKLLPADVVDALCREAALETPAPAVRTIERPVTGAREPERYPFRGRSGGAPAFHAIDRRRELADPELTRIKRQRRNLAHKELVDSMDSWLRQLGAQPQENDHIDLLAKIPADGSFIFEMKSGGESLLDQIRKGVSQLYEYRYRYRREIADDSISLCLVLPENPVDQWLTDYLCVDREISICWFDGANLVWPEACAQRIAPLTRPAT